MTSKTNKWKRTVVWESLGDDRILNNFDIVDFKIADEEKPGDRWHLFTT